LEADFDVAGGSGEEVTLFYLLLYGDILEVLLGGRLVRVDGNGECEGVAGIEAVLEASKKVYAIVHIKLLTKII
jgi:hypothetical protein